MYIYIDQLSVYIWEKCAQKYFTDKVCRSFEKTVHWFVKQIWKPDCPSTLFCEQIALQTHQSYNPSSSLVLSLVTYFLMDTLIPSVESILRVLSSYLLLPALFVQDSDYCHSVSDISGIFLLLKAVNNIIPCILWNPWLEKKMRISF